MPHERLEARSGIGEIQGRIRRLASVVLVAKAQGRVREGCRVARSPGETRGSAGVLAGEKRGAASECGGDASGGQKRRDLHGGGSVMNLESDYVHALLVRAPHEFPTVSLFRRNVGAGRLVEGRLEER